VDVAKEAADIVLLEKRLLVLEEGIMEGRRIFANIIKYIRMAASSNFGNMYSVVGASYLLPFLPMQPLQILTNNLLYDFSQTGIPMDNVDPELVAKPVKWDINNIKRFMMYIGPISSISITRHSHSCGSSFMQTAILIRSFGCAKRYYGPALPNRLVCESLLTQTLIVHIIRTKAHSLFPSRASVPMILTTLT
jgi:Mg2+-importing ATPase